MRRDQRRLRSILRDPDSAQFGQTYPNVRDGLPITCGYANAKNAFSGYTGERMWIVIADLNVAVVETPVKGESLVSFGTSSARAETGSWHDRMAKHWPTADLGHFHWLAACVHFYLANWQPRPELGLKADGGR